MQFPGVGTLPFRCREGGGCGLEAVVWDRGGWFVSAVVRQWNFFFFFLPMSSYELMGRR